MNFLSIAKEVINLEKDGLSLMADQLSEDFSKAVSSILESKGRVVVTGMGKSGLVGKKIAATLASTGTKSFFMHPGEAYHGDLGMLHESDVIIAISYSGETEEISRILSFFKENGNKVIGISKSKESTLGKYSDYFLSVGAAKEACPLDLAPTTSTTATMVMGDALAVALMRARNFQPESFARFHPGGSLGKKLLLRVKDVMRVKNLPILSENDSFETIITVLSSGMMGIAIVLNESKIVGVITDGDIRRSLQANGAETIKLKASYYCTKTPLMIDAEAKIVHAEEIMNQKKVTVLLVAKDKELVGTLHRYDL